MAFKAVHQSSEQLTLELFVNVIRVRHGGLYTHPLCLPKDQPVALEPQLALCPVSFGCSAQVGIVFVYFYKM